tara:strand:+ start:461 stop:1747 length:1287 start_codon:yes stop_codon:yes gene_type:complete
MIKILFRYIIIISFIFLFINTAYAFNLNKVYSLNTVSAAKIEINDTNLVDEENAEKLVSINNDFKKSLEEESKVIQEKNKNRKRPKFKGGVEIYEDYSNSVVFIGNRVKGKMKTVGSGFVINHNGPKIITNWHVIEGADTIHVWLKPSDEVDENYLIEKVDSFTAKLIKTNKKKDLAMIEVSGLPLKAKPVKYGSFKNIKIGETLFAIGHPEGLLWSLTSGMVSQKRPKYKWRYKSSSHLANVIQTQAPINPGNSGGPLFDKNNRLVGVNTFTAEGENLNFAVAVDDLIDFIQEKAKPIKKKNKYIKKKDKGNTWIKKKKKKSSEGSIDLSKAVEADVNENGVIDTWLIDENNNGIYELAYSDVDEDGIIDLAAIDKNEDKNFEVFLMDEDQNGDPEYAEIDENEDGISDIKAYDYNEDGEWDKYEKI